MKRVWGHVLAALTVVAGVSAAFFACVHNDSTIFISNVLAPQTSSQPGTRCLFTADPMQPFISNGVLDIALRPSGYDAAFLLGNQMVATANSSQLITETSIVKISHAEFRVTTSDGRQLETHTRVAAADIPPASGNTPGYSSIARVKIVSADSLASDAVTQPLTAGGTVRLLSFVRFFGKTLGGQSVESNEFEFPVDVCNGCLIAFTNNRGCPIPNCVGNASATATASQPVVPCVDSIGQDAVMDCNTCVNMGLDNCLGAYPSTMPCLPDAGTSATDSGSGG